MFDWAVRALYQKGAKPTAYRLQRDRAEVSGIKAAWTEGANYPELAFLNLVCPCRERVKLPTGGIAVHCCCVWQQMTIDGDPGGGSLHGVARPCNHGLDERRKSIGTGAHWIPVVGLFFHRWPSNVGTEENVRCWIVGRIRGVRDFAVETKRRGMRVVENHAECDSCER